jgi:hypothetical protein
MTLPKYDYAGHFMGYGQFEVKGIDKAMAKKAGKKFSKRIKAIFTREGAQDHH